MGFITNDSQDGIRTYGNIPSDVPDYVSKQSKLYKKFIQPLWNKEWKSDNEENKAYKEAREKLQHELIKQYKKGFHKGLEHSQRAYMSGFMRKDLAFVFHYLFNEDTDKICMTSDYERIPVTYQIGFSPSDPTYPFGKSYKLHQQYLAGYVPTGTNAGFFRDPKDNQNMFNDLRILVPKTKQKLEKYFTHVTCVDPTHGRKATSKNGLFTDIMRILKKSRSILDK